MNTPTTLQMVGAALFGIAVLHTFSTQIFERLAHSQPRHAGLWHLLGEVEVVFGFWAMVLVVCMFALSGKQAAVGYLESRDFTEPLFVFAIMVVAGTRPILQVAGDLVHGLARWLPLKHSVGMYVLLLAFVPLLGSFITEPAAMTLAALMLRDLLFAQAVSTRLKYVTLGVLFVNISIGGTLTHFAAPPVLMVAALAQPLAGLVFVLDGVLIGAGDARYLARAGTLVLLVFAPSALLAPNLVWLWVAFCVFFMGGRGLALWTRSRGDSWMHVGGGLGTR